ncbi:hypothetical protein Poli38472_002980 [Pythium oligandrum]|uniref:F-box/LRR-repeat protein 15-like leucin rich repeat domain-containing protein n=1 Tax=Pythium oligandrum TaxID=41045 RepID=A0A8K1C5Y8_PYTOL|nr:hypothetical protein Poli38472_002980 [Pythium oligandrum]|eukprot:TMW57055.1 hypothetical protein Poli38472_002980 [Pythium oligandrum]
MRCLVMNGAEHITDIGLQAIGEHVPTLEALEIANAVKVSDAGLRALAMQCTRLNRLNLSSCSGIRGAGLAAIAEHCHSMVDLGLAECHQFEEWVLLRCIYSFTSLENLNVARCPQITDYLLKTIGQQCPKLRSLNLAECHQVSDVGVVQLAQKCHFLARIALCRTQHSEKITDTTCAALGEHCPVLEDVNLTGCNFLTDASVRWLAEGCTHLQSLDISQVFHVTDASLRALSEHCADLTSLRLNNVKNVSDVGLRFLSMGCPRLESLHVSNLYLVSDGSNRDFGLEGLQAIAKGCTSIKELNLSGCFQLVERALIALGSSCTKIKKLNLKACPRVTLLAVNALLHGCPTLTSLNLSGVQLCNNAMLAAIASHGVALKELCVAQCDKISDPGLWHLARRADQFETLDLSGCNLLTDIGLNAFLDGLQKPALTHLHLAGCTQITQDPIARLAFVCPMLLTLSVQGCRISARTLHSLSSSWPFGEVRVPTGIAATQSNAEFGIFPAQRAKDRRYVEETCVFWAAAVKIQNLFRARLARRQALINLEEARRLYVARRLQSIWRGREARREALLRKLFQSGIHKSAAKIQRRYRATRQARKAHTQMQAIFEKEFEKFVVLVQRRYRAKRAANVANAIIRARRKQYEREVEAAIIVQRRFRGIVGRRRFNLVQLQRLAREREEQEASKRLQAIYRGRMDRMKAKQLENERRLEQEGRNQHAIQIQAQFRRHLARKEMERRREYRKYVEQSVIKLQTAYRARRGRREVDILRLAQQQLEAQRAAMKLQTHWRGRRARSLVATLRNARRLQEELEIRSATHLQRTFRRYLIRKWARAVMIELIRAKQADHAMEVWAATLVQAHWRRIQACRELERIQIENRTRWKHLIDTYNQHGCGYGAPFYYNQVNGEIRWRMPREILMLQPRPACNQCDATASASVECATCCENFCEECNVIVHGNGKRRLHTTRKLFNIYGIRCDYGDGEFPSIWPTEMEQDHQSGYDFVNMAPKENYQDMLWKIAQFEPVVTGKWLKEVVDTTSSPVESHVSTDETVFDPRGLLYQEDDVDEHGNSLWESFYDYTRGEYRYYHRVSKRVTSEPPHPQPSALTPPEDISSS